MAIQKTPTFDDLELAKAYATEQSAQHPRARSVYRLAIPSPNGGEPVTKFIVAQSVVRAQNHAFALVRDMYGLKLGVAERSERNFKPKSLEETVRALSPEEIERVKAMLSELAPEPEKRKSRKSEA